MELDRNAIGKRIKKIRTDKKWTLEQFGQLVLDAGRGTVSNWENGTFLPNDKRLERIALIGNISVEELLYGSIPEFIETIFNIFEKNDFHIENQTKDYVLSVAQSKQYSYHNISNIIGEILNLHPDFAYQNNYHSLLGKFNVFDSQVRTFSFENDALYRRNILPLLKELLENDDSESLNSQNILALLDMLCRSNTSNKESIFNIIKYLSWISTQNITSFPLESMAEKAVFGGVSSFKSSPRNEIEIKNDFLELSHLINKEIEILFQNINK